MWLLQIARKLKGIGDDLDAKVKKEIAEATSAFLSNRSLFQVCLYWSCLPPLHSHTHSLELPSSIACVPESFPTAPLCSGVAGSRLVASSPPLVMCVSVGR